MNINCIICSDLFLPSSDIYITKCGHIFHYTCLLQWLERSKTCPQCRTKATNNNLFRVYFNIVNVEGNASDPVTLQNELDTVKLQLRLKDNFVKTCEDELKTLKEELEIIKKQNKELKEDNAKSQSGLASLKEQMHFYKGRLKHVEKLETEVQELRTKDRARERAAEALTAPMDHFTKLLNECECKKTLASIASNLKKELLNTDNKKNKIYSNFKKTDAELTNLKKEYGNLHTVNNSLKHSLKMHEDCDKLIETLKKKILVLEERARVDGSNFCTASPSSLKSTKNVTPTVVERIKRIQESSSPYLELKLNSIGEFASFSERKDDEPSLFRRPTSLLEYKGPLSYIPEGSYNGLGGHSKEDLFPNGRNSSFKRSRSTPLSSKLKMKKVARLPEKMSSSLSTSSTDPSNCNKSKSEREKADKEHNTLLDNFLKLAYKMQDD